MYFVVSGSIPVPQPNLVIVISIWFNHKPDLWAGEPVLIRHLGIFLFRGEFFKKQSCRMRSTDNTVYYLCNTLPFYSNIQTILYSRKKLIV